MKKTGIPNTDLGVSRLGFGTARLHHLLTSRNRQNVLSAAHDSGFSHFDLAPSYGFGLAEMEFGKWPHSNSDKITVASKFGLYPPGVYRGTSIGIWPRKLVGKLDPRFSKPRVDWSLKAARTSLDRTLKSIQRDYLDILFLHEPLTRLIDQEALIDWLTKVRDEGKIRFWGVAGDRNAIDPLVDCGSRLAQVIQIRDDRTEAFRSKYLSERPVAHFTFGYMKTKGRGLSDTPPIRRSIMNALDRNRAGSILVGSTKIEHIRELALLAD